MDIVSKLVSVIVPCYNQGQYLAEALDSVIEQTYQNWECIIINDGSTDNTEDIAKSYCQKDERFHYIYQENQGVIAARNNAIAASHGEYILPLDGDDIIEADYLRLSAKILSENENVCVVTCQVMQFGAINGIWKQQPEINLRNMLYGGCIVCTSMFRRTGFDKVGGFKEEMKAGYEDWEFFISILEQGGKVHKIEKPLFKYRIQNRSRNNTIPEEIQKELRSKVVGLHPSLYAEQYRSLFSDYNSVIMSKKYRIAKLIGKIIGSKQKL